MSTATAARRARPPEPDPREAGARMVKLVEERGYLASILGSDPATVERFKTVLLSALTGSPKLLQADPASLVQAMREAAMWDLEPDGVDAVIVPYWTSKRGVYEADFQVTARGYVRVLYRSPKVRFVDADVIYEADTFEYEKGATPRLVHKPAMFGDRGKRIGAYALVVIDSGFVRPIVLNEEAIAARRKRARDAEGGTWAEWPDEMARKTALRALISMVPIARGVKAALAAEDAKYAALPAPAPVAAIPERVAEPVPAIEAARAAFVGSPEPFEPEPSEPDEPAPDSGLPEMTPGATEPAATEAGEVEGTFVEAPVEEPPLPPAPPAQAAAAAAGLSAAALGALAVQAGKTKGEIAVAIGSLGQPVPAPTDVTAAVRALTDADRGRLCDELNLDWRAA